MERKLRLLLDGGSFGSVEQGDRKRMRSNRSTGSRSTERRCRAILASSGVSGWVIQPDHLPGKPDFLFPILRVVLFVDGCYWHGCPRCAHDRNKNRNYWSAKIAGNKARDRRNSQRLRRLGYRVVRVWEHELVDGLAGAWFRRLIKVLEWGTR